MTDVPPYFPAGLRWSRTCCDLAWEGVDGVACGGTGGIDWGGADGVVFGAPTGVDFGPLAAPAGRGDNTPPTVGLTLPQIPPVRFGGLQATHSH